MKTPSQPARTAADKTARWDDERMLDRYRRCTQRAAIEVHPAAAIAGDDPVEDR